MLHFYLTLLDLITLLLRGSFLKGAKELKKKQKTHCIEEDLERSTLPWEKSFGLALVPGNTLAEMEVNTSLELVIHYFSTSPLTRRQGAQGKSLAAIARLGGDSLPQQKEWLFSITAWSFLAVLGHLFYSSFSLQWHEVVLLFFSSYPHLWKPPSPKHRGSSPNKDRIILK